MLYQSCVLCCWFEWFSLGTVNFGLSFHSERSQSSSLFKLTFTTLRLVSQDLLDPLGVPSLRKIDSLWIYTIIWYDVFMDIKDAFILKLEDSYLYKNSSCVKFECKYDYHNCHALNIMSEFSYNDYPKVDDISKWNLKHGFMVPPTRPLLS